MCPPSNGDPSLTVLHLEDSPRDAEIVGERLADAGRQVRVDWAAHEREFESFLRHGEYDVILADYELPGFDAPAALLAAGSPGDAVLLCETHPGEIDVLLTDVVMPKMNGNELRERLERIKPGLRTVLMSGYAADATTHREIVDRGQCFIQRPFTRDALASKIREALQG